MDKYVEEYFNEFKKIAKDYKDDLMLGDIYENFICDKFFELNFSLRKVKNGKEAKHALNLAPRMRDSEEQEQRKSEMREEMQKELKDLSRDERKRRIEEMYNKLQEKIDKNRTQQALI